MAERTFQITVTNPDIDTQKLIVSCTAHYAGKNSEHGIGTSSKVDATMKGKTAGDRVHPVAVSRSHLQMPQGQSQQAAAYQFNHGRID